MSRHFFRAVSIVAVAFSLPCLTLGIQQNPEGPATIEGIVVAAATGDPLPNAEITLRTVGGRMANTERSVTTAADGTFRLEALPRGNYRLTAAGAEGYVPMDYGQRSLSSPGRMITLLPGERMSGVRFALTRTGAISGRIYDAEGEPLAGAMVHALRRAYLQDAGLVLGEVASAEADDRGEYRLSALPPDHYYIRAGRKVVDPIFGTRVSIGGVSAQVTSVQFYPPDEGVVSEDGELREVVYLPTYFPTATDFRTVAPLELDPAVELSNIDVTIAAPVPAWHVRGAVFDGATGQPVSGATLGLASDTFTTIAYSGFFDSPATGPDGEFDIAGLSPGTYTLYASLEEAGTSVPFRFQIGAGNVDNIVLALTDGVDIPARVHIDGEVEPGGYLTYRLVRRGGLTNPGPFPQPPGAPIANLLAEEEFVLQGVRPGDYFLTGGVNRVNSGYVESVRLGTRDVLAEGLQVIPPVDGVLEFTIGTSPGTVEGTVVDERGEAAVYATVVVAADPPNRYRTGLTRNVLPDANGRFRIENVPPGSYRVYAWADVMDRAWQAPEFLEQYLALGERIHVDPNGTVTVEVRLIPAGR